MIELEALKISTDKFDEKEPRTDFFSMAQNLIKKGFETEGMLLILATWNFAGIRYAIKEFDIDNFRSVLTELEPHYCRFKGQEFATIKFDNYYEDISRIYNTLSKIKGIQYTGASKLMHLKCPDVFVMWDGYIRGEKPMKYYREIEAKNPKLPNYKKYSSNASGYIEFLKNMQDQYKHLLFKDDNKTLPKAIDEFNYVNITLKYQEIEKRLKLSKSKKI